MAKVRSPLFSLGASGKLAGSLVYMNWKGIDDVRMYVIPANPNTTAQQTQRGYLTNAVNNWHTAGFNATDLAAWDRYATSLPSPMSGFNAFCSEYIKAKVAGNDFTPLYAVDITPGSDQVQVTIKCSADKTAKLYWGSSITRMPNEVSGTYDGVTNTWTFTISSLSSGMTIYFYIKNTAAGESGRSGVYTATTT